MPFYEWSEAMSVGLPVLDSDHKALITLINTLHKELELDEEPAKLAEVFEKLVLYVDYHFAREESVMKACAYPAIDAHREEHKKLAQEIHYFRDRHIRGGEARIGQELLNFLKDWLNHHILMQDMHYKKYAQGNPRALDAAERFGPGLSDPNWKRPGGC
jgi:hemerythrin-like metal-binding protein